jgi:hypothetical protein
MTDTPPVQPTPGTPVPPAASVGGAPAGPAQTQSIVGFILSIASILFSGLGIIGIGLGIAGIIVSGRAKKAEPAAPSWMHSLGKILGIVGIVLSVIVGLIVLVGTILPLILAANYSSVS